MTTPHPPLIRAAALALASILLTACGGAPDSVPLSTPVLTVTPQATKTLHFSWPDVVGETGYRLLEDPDGASGFNVLATLPANTTSHDLAVFLPERVNARYLLQACDARGCINAPVATLTTALHNTVGYVKASNTTTGATFSYAMALSADGSTLAVGALSEASNATGIAGNQSDQGAPDSGAVYVFARSGARWQQQAYVKASNTDAGDQFGFSIALSADGHTLAVGAPTEDSAATGIGGDQADNTASASGVVYVFTRSGATWSQQAYVKPTNTGADDQFGIAVALSANGQTLAVGAFGEDSAATGTGGDAFDNSASTSGAVYVFTRSAATWSQQAYVKASNTDANDQFGSAVALSADGNTLVVGALWEASGATGVNGPQADNGVPFSGAAYVFTHSGGIWSQQAYVKASNTDAGDHFGAAVAISADGNTLAVGAYAEDGGAPGINGDQLDKTASSSGAAYVFTRNGATWSQQAHVKASDPDAGDRFGLAVALSADGDTLAAGAFWEDSNASGLNGDPLDNTAANSGAAYVFKRAGGLWRQQAYVKAPDTTPGDHFGSRVALSPDGRTLAVGAPGERSNATGIGGDQNNNAAPGAGAVYLY